MTGFEREKRLDEKPLFQTIVLLLLCVFGPLVALVGAPTLVVAKLLKEADVHPGIVLAGSIGTLLLAIYLIYLFMAVVPQSWLTFLGFILYGALGMFLGSDFVWGIVIGCGTGIVGAVLFSLIGRGAKRFRYRNVVYDYDDDGFEYDYVDDR